MIIKKQKILQLQMEYPVCYQATCNLFVLKTEEPGSYRILYTGESANSFFIELTCINDLL